MKLQRMVPKMLKEWNMYKKKTETRTNFFFVNFSFNSVYFKIFIFPPFKLLLYISILAYNVCVCVPVA